MKKAAIVVAAVLLASPVRAQGLGGFLNKAADAKQKYDEWNINDKEEQQIGADVSAKLCDRFGVVQDEAVTRYVSLVGAVLAQASSRPNLPWKFIVLDTDGVNAFAAPGGYIHVTRGLLGLIKSEAQLAGALGHEMTHVTEKHTINAIKRSKAISMGANQAGNGSLRGDFISKVADRTFENVFNGQFSQTDERAADEGGVRLANKVGYSPVGLVDVLKAIDARNSGGDARNGWFASHPATQERITALEKQIASEHLASKATVEARYTQHVTFVAIPTSQIAMDVKGAAGLAGSDSSSKKDDGKNSGSDQPTDQPKKKGLMGGVTSITSSKQNQSSQTVASAGARGLGTPDRDAKGGPNRNPLRITITPGELESFKKGIVA
ncbi:MAG TPA: M48 family metalloprotease [Vicinamibacterales bacterium]|jgi:predicted Zn-dependent protease